MVVGLAIPPSKNMLDIEATASTPSLVKLWPYISYGRFMELIRRRKNRGIFKEICGTNETLQKN